MVIIGKSIKIGIGFLLLLTLSVVTMGTVEAVLTVVAVLIHEFGHILAVALSGGRVKTVRAGVAGMELIYISGDLSYACDMLLATAGPAASFFAGMLCVTLGKYFGFSYSEFFAGINLIFCLFNLIPVSALDGGKILHAAVAAIFGPFFAERTRVCVDAAIISILFVGGIYVAIKFSHNPTLLICAVMILKSCCKSHARGVKSHKR